MYSDVRTVRELLGHSDDFATMIYTFVLKGVAGGTASSLDTLSVAACGPLAIAVSGCRLFKNNSNL